VYKIIFSARERCYVYLYQVGHSGEVEQLFPRSSYTGLNPENVNPVQPEKRYAIPAHDKSFELVEQSGLQALYFLAFRQRHVLLEEHYDEMLKAQLNNDNMTLKLAQKKFMMQFRSAGAFGIRPSIQQYAAEQNQPDNITIAEAIPTTEQQIVEALRVDLLSTKGIHATELADMPRTVALIQFTPGSAEIRKESFPLLHAYGRALQGALKNASILIASHTHEGGARIKNQVLSRQRAEAVRQFFIVHYHIPEQRLHIQAYGAEKPLFTHDGQQYTNRIEFIRIQ
jgi:outer membrane protein OmpA-like peptidoglycan-associated protein